jgi:propanediol dehydratase small subunit
MLLYPFIRNLTISHGRAAEILGVHKTDLIEFYDSMGIPYLNQSEEELMADLATLDRVMGAQK